MPNILLLPECNADTALTRILAPDTAEIDHIFGVFNVVKEMKSALINRPEYTVIGIVDRDVTYKPERRPPYFDGFVYEEIGNKLSLGRKPEVSQYLIMLDKAIETFLLWNAIEVNIDVVQYGFPDPNTDFRRFCKKIKGVSIGLDPNYRQLLTDLYARNAPGLITLQTLLHDLFPA